MRTSGRIPGLRSWDTKIPDPQDRPATRAQHHLKWYLFGKKHLPLQIGAWRYSDFRSPKPTPDPGETHAQATLAVEAQEAPHEATR